MRKTTITCDLCQQETKKCNEGRFTFQLQLGNKVIRIFPFLETVNDTCDSCLQKVNDQLIQYINKFTLMI